MVRTHIRRVSVGVAVAVFLLTGCSGPDPSVAETTTLGLPEGFVLETTDFDLFATWVEPDETFAIVTWGSSSCPSIPTALTVEARDRIAVTFSPSPNDPCTANMAPTTHEFTLPDDVTASPVIIDVSYDGRPETDTLTLE